MAKTKAQLSRAVLQRLVYSPDQEPSAADSATVEARYDSKLLEWRGDGLVYWTNTTRDTEEIPDRLFAILTDLMVNEVRDDFKRDNPIEQQMARETMILSRLRSHLAKGPSGEATTFSSY